MSSKSRTNANGTNANKSKDSRRSGAMASSSQGNTRIKGGIATTPAIASASGIATRKGINAERTIRRTGKGRGDTGATGTEAGTEITANRQSTERATVPANQISETADSRRGR